MNTDDTSLKRPGYWFGVIEYRLREKMREDTEANEKAGWIDQTNGIAQIPVQDAMKIIAEKGLPAAATPPAEKKKK